MQQLMSEVAANGCFLCKLTDIPSTYTFNAINAILSMLSMLAGERETARHTNSLPLQVKVYQRAEWKRKGVGHSSV
jgi:hypothetical protein